MLVFPQWRPEISGGGCRTQRWMDAERFAPYLARPMVLPPPPPQYGDEDSVGGSSPERVEGVESKEGVCEWRGCGARFPSVARLSAHVARLHAHAYRDGLFYCGWRGCARPQKGFNARYKMLVHVRTHTNERPHTCNQCNKSFSRAENLKIHLRSHSGEKPYICPYEGCGKAYSNSSDRFKHTRTHTVDKPYFCKVAGCNKRYTDPSSLRKHVKTYKHFTTKKESPRRESEDEKIMERLSPRSSEIPTYINHPSPIHTGMYSPPKSIPSPQISPYEPVVPMTEPSLTPPYTYVPVLDQVTYIRPLDPVYPLRVPTNELSYIEYTHMYDHAYRNYYLNSINYPVLRPSITEKVYRFEEQTKLNDVPMDVPETSKVSEDTPLNLICTRRMECKPIEELVKITDLPLDLSTKS